MYDLTTCADADCRVPMFPCHGPPRDGATRHGGRGLCSRCYPRHRRQGTLDNWTRSLKRGRDVLEDWRWLHETGQLSEHDTINHRVREAAPRLGMSVDGLAKALERAGVRSPYYDTGERKAVA